jgi:hypothetical protein
MDMICTRDTATHTGAFLKLRTAAANELRRIVRINKLTSGAALAKHYGPHLPQAVKMPAIPMAKIGWASRNATVRGLAMAKEFAGEFDQGFVALLARRAIFRAEAAAHRGLAGRSPQRIIRLGCGR